MTDQINDLVVAIQRCGWSVEFRDYCEDVETPGFLGRLAGICVFKRRAVKVRTRGFDSPRIAAILAHELEHINGARKGTDYPEYGFRCGGTV